MGVEHRLSYRGDWMRRRAAPRRAGIAHEITERGLLHLKETVVVTAMLAYS
jgi:hypothetical protein